VNIKERVKEIQDYIQRLDAEILYIRETCPHLDASVEHIGSTGNFDPMDDGYVKYFKCKDCGKSWSEE
jgi:transposase-like protein